MNYIDIAKQLVLHSGGEVSGRIVTKVGVKILYDYNGFTADGRNIIESFAALRKDDFDEGKISDYHKLVDFAARITYLSYQKTSAKELQRRIQEEGHYNVYDLHGIVVLVAGVSLECLLELVSNRCNRSCRLTSSKTKAAIETLYAKTVDPLWLNRFLELRKEYLDNTANSLEYSNMFNLSSKCGYAVISMGVRDWNAVINSRLNDKELEEEMRDVLVEIHHQIKSSKNWIY